MSTEHNERSPRPTRIAIVAERFGIPEDILEDVIKKIFIAVRIAGDRSLMFIDPQHVEDRLERVYAYIQTETQPAPSYSLEEGAAAFFLSVAARLRLNQYSQADIQHTLTTGETSTVLDAFVNEVRRIFDGFPQAQKTYIELTDKILMDARYSLVDA